MAMTRSRFLRAAVAGAFTLAAGHVFAGAPVAAAPGTWCAPRCDELVIAWNHTTHQVITADEGYQNPMVASRALAMVHLAMHDAINGAQPRYATYALRERAADADPAIAAVTAAHDVLLALYPKQKALLAAALQPSLLEAGRSAGVAAGQALGARAARAVLERRADDGAARTETYTVRNVPGAWRFTPGFDFIASPQWRAVTPFALQSPSQFRVAAPPALTSVAYTAAFDEVKRMGGAQRHQRSADQSHLAAFWYEFSDIGWNRIARVVSRQQPMDLAARARLFALLNVAMADSYIAGWDSKMHHDFWRPVTAIRLAATDGNAATQPDAAWAPMLVTPPIQDHPSTHSALGAAAAAVLAHAFGRDEVGFAFTSTSADAANPVRSFAGFSDAARENAESRVLAGLHFRFAIEAGLQLGRNVGATTVTTLLQPLH